ncbi:MAG: arginase [Moorea sp. SIO3C2]|nr:arginase [Moorena sp. SIO3C2]
MSDEELRIGNLFGGDAGGGLFDIPRRDPGDVDGADVVVMGAATATPYESVGAYCADGPAAIRAAVGWPGMGAHYDFDLDGPLLGGGHAVDWGDLPIGDDLAENRSTIRRHVKTVLEGGAVPVLLGGDDSIPIPALSAFMEHGPIVILQLDAHIDWRDEVQGERMGLSSNMRRASEMAWVDHIVQVGARGSGSARTIDVQDAHRWGVDFFPMRFVRRDGLQPVVDAIPEGSSVYVALDIDALDPSVVPGVIGPAPGGFDAGSCITISNQ